MLLSHLCSGVGTSNPRLYERTVGYSTYQLEKFAKHTMPFSGAELHLIDLRRKGFALFFSEIVRGND